MLGSDGKRCGVCGDEMDCLDYGGGSVWSCTTHGVRDWMFDDAGPSLVAHERPSPPTAAARALREPKVP